MKKYIIIIMMITLLSSLFSYSLMDRVNGNMVNNFDARSLAMGSASVAGGNNLFNTLTNPSNLNNIDSNWGIALSAKFLMNTDNRALPMYNSFDGYSGEGTYVSNVNIFDDQALGLYYQLPIAEMKLGAAVLYHPFINFDSDYFEQIRNNQNSDSNSYPPIIAKNYIFGSGNIQAISFVTSFKYENIASLGVRISKLYGDSQLERKINWTDEALAEISTLTDSYADLNRDYDGMSFQVGANVNISDRIGLGFSISPKIDFDVKGTINDIVVQDVIYAYTQWDTAGVPTDSLTFADYSIPMNVRVGLNYRPRNIMRTNFNIDAEFVKWSDINFLYDDVINYYIGVEHDFNNSIPIRFGFNYITEFCLNEQDGYVFASKVVSPSFSTGTGFTLLNKIEWNTSLEFSYRSYETLDLFMDSFYDYDDLWEYPQYLNFQDRGWENPDTVNETNLELQTSISYKW